MKDGEPFVVKGVNYAPLPPGSLPTEATQWGDLFHRDWSHLHDRDIPLLRAAGVNSIRVYQLQLQYPNSDIDLDHTGFFDKLYNNGVDPIYIFITYALSDGFTHAGPFDTRPENVDYAFQTTDGKWHALENEAENAIKRDNERDIMVAIAQKYKNHPAVMGFVIGNEQNDAITRSNCKYWEWLDEIDAAVKQEAPNLLTATTIVDDAMITVAESVRCNGLTNMDVWGINSYRGTATTGFHELFAEFTSIINNKALLITEFGCPASARVDNQFAMLPENSRLQADYLESHWNDIVLHFNVCSGGHVFSWVDEWWKNTLPNEQTPNDVAQNFAFPGEWADEEAWGLFAVSVDCDNVASWSTRVDQVLPRAVYYRMAKLFGGIDEEPANAYEPINYPRCNGQWVGTPNAPNPPVSIPLPVTQEPESVPITTQSPSVLSVPATENDQTSSAVQHLPFVFLLFLFCL